MTFLPTTTTRHGRPPPQATDRLVHAMRIVVCGKKFVPATDIQGHYLRLAIWLAGWCIAIYDE